MPTNYRKLIKAIAKKEGTSVNQVRKAMQEAINETYKSPNIHAERIPSKGEIPTIEEFLEYTIAKSTPKI